MKNRIAAREKQMKLAREVMQEMEKQKRSTLRNLKALLNRDDTGKDDVIILYSPDRLSKSISNTDINLLISNT